MWHERAASSDVEAASRLPRSVVAVGGQPPPVELIDALLGDGSGYDVIVVESLAGGYSRIKQLTPDLVIVLLESDGIAACQLLSMLQVDGTLSGTLVVTYAARDLHGRDAVDVVVAEGLEGSSSYMQALQMN
jgi:hypothetical protein